MVEWEGILMLAVSGIDLLEQSELGLFVHSHKSIVSLH